MKVLVIGGGGREHAVCKKLSESKDVTEILCAPGNAGIAQVARCIPEVKATDIEGIVAGAPAPDISGILGDTADNSRAYAAPKVSCHGKKGEHGSSACWKFLRGNADGARPHDSNGKSADNTADQSCCRI